ncbi:hypothetical protein BGX30_006490, partial [Mortierella sp. GBA39]
LKYTFAFYLTMKFNRLTVLGLVSFVFVARVQAEGNDNDAGKALRLTAIVKALDLAGFRYPIGKNKCVLCQGVCNRILSGVNVDHWKYDACVKFLGGYKGTEDTPSCALIPLP